MAVDEMQLSFALALATSPLPSEISPGGFDVILDDSVS
jgi:hypothetical protein